MPPSREKLKDGWESVRVCPPGTLTDSRPDATRSRREQANPQTNPLTRTVRRITVSQDGQHLSQFIVNPLTNKEESKCGSSTACRQEVHLRDRLTRYTRQDACQITQGEENGKKEDDPDDAAVNKDFESVDRFRQYRQAISL